MNTLYCHSCTVTVNKPTTTTTAQLTFNFQVEGTAVKLVFVGDLTPVIPCIVIFGFDDMHLKSMYLQGDEKIITLGAN